MRSKEDRTRNHLLPQSWAQDVHVVLANEVKDPVGVVDRVRTIGLGAFMEEIATASSTSGSSVGPSETAPGKGSVETNGGRVNQAVSVESSEGREGRYTR